MSQKNVIEKLYYGHMNLYQYFTNWTRNQIDKIQVLVQLFQLYDCFYWEIGPTMFELDDYKYINKESKKKPFKSKIN